MRVVLVGLGSIGKRHLDNLRGQLPAADVVVVRHSNRGEPAPPGVNRVVFSIDEAVALKPDLALICSPTTMHVEAATAIAATGAHLFVEKPLASTVEDGEQIIRACRRGGGQLIVGYNLRLLPSLKTLKEAIDSGQIGRAMSVRAEVGQYLPEWRPGTDYRQSNSARASLGGGIELELSHEIDYVQWLLGNVTSVSGLVDRLSDLQIDADDTAELLLKFSSGAVGSIHMDMAQRSVVRRCRVAGTEGTLEWDGVAGKVDRYVPGDGWVTLHSGDGERNEMYAEEMRHVLACVRGEERPFVSGSDALHTIQIAQAARRSSAEGQRVQLPA